MKVREFTLDQLGEVARGRSRHRPRDAAFLYGGPYPFVQTGDVKRAGLYLTEYEQTYSEAGLAGIDSQNRRLSNICCYILAHTGEREILLNGVLRREGTSEGARELHLPLDDRPSRSR